LEISGGTLVKFFIRDYLELLKTILNLPKKKNVTLNNIEISGGTPVRRGTKMAVFTSKKSKKHKNRNPRDKLQSFGDTLVCRGTQF
jgi:hypothetical protein